LGKLRKVTGTIGDNYRDRIRTSVNVLGDGFGCGIIFHLTKGRLAESDNDELVQQLKSDIKLLNAELPTVTPKLTRASIDVGPRLQHEMLPTTSAQLTAPQPVGYQKSRGARGLLVPGPAAIIRSQGHGLPHVDSRRTSITSSRIGYNSADRDERRSLLEGSMEFTV
jgi:hypothetical protein